MEFEETLSQDGLGMRPVLKLENENPHKASLPRSCHVNFKHTNRCREGRYPGRKRSRKLPSCTTAWDVTDLDSVGIYYKDKPDKMSTILDMVYSESEMFGGLSSEQSEFVKTLENSFTFSFDTSDLLVYSSQGLDMLLIDSIKEDVNDNGRILTNLGEHFIRNLILMIKCYDFENEGSLRKDGRKSGSEAVFIDLFTIFVRMTGVLAGPGAMFKSTMNILQKSVTAEPDVVILAGNILENPKVVCAVSVVEIQCVEKGMSYCQKSRQKDPETSSSLSSSSLSSYSEHSDNDEKPVHDQPDIFKRIPSKLLAQHGGQLLVLSQLYTGQHFTKDKIKKLIPGIIVMGTQVTFTLLEYSVNHMKDLFLNNVNRKERSYIYYTEPMDYLKKDDRNLLFESIVRLSNVKH
ncbi:Hypothetical predicted protein [Mytilus galloprovincialis]|uniref:Uncharacterized protein n=1 Tax=Mytilus galloprovincialis TaxID=29158 RepID=A0A8B6FLW5_MYTGA|nr:Hypothetical predicted protein [Mytilus galloprovincialis]